MSTDTSARPRLGADFGRLWTATAAANIGDGVVLAAGPLLVAGLTDDPALVSGAVFVQQLPWLLFALVSGALVDRLDRRRLIVAVNLARAGVIGGLALAVWSDQVTIALIYLAFFLLGVGETLADNAAGALLPAVVAPEALPRANARLMAVFYVGNQFVAPPIGAALFVVAAAVPFGVNAATFLVAALLIAALRYRQPPAEPGERKPLRTEIAEGMRWLWAHRLLRTIAVCLCVMNIALYAAFAILVLYAREHLGLPEVGFGLLLTAGAVGGLLGTLVVERLQRWVGDSVLLRVGLVIETATHVGLALTDDPWVAGAIMLAFGVHGAVWGVVAMSVRQRVVPDRLRGRVGGVSRLLIIGGAAIGSLIGGFIAREFGVTAPLWAAAAAMVVVTALAWRHFRPDAFER
ncbi:MFS transporter [Actinokineospora sp.]|uniref:MFS transporter n=1 Tax=Actinokineospora sp. TaxID=1872133 RepID=UPI0040380E3A